MKRHRPWDKKVRSSSSSWEQQQQQKSKLTTTTTTPATKTSNIDHHHHKNNPVSIGHNDDDSVVPYVMIDGQKFYSDRFYINTTIYDNDDNGDDCVSTSATTATNATNATKNDELKIQEQQRFDRSKFLQSYFCTNNNGKTNNNLRAVMFGTYTVDDTTLRQEFPHLFIDHHYNHGSTSSHNSTTGSTTTDGKCNTNSSRHHPVNVPCLVLYGKRYSTKNSNNSGDNDGDDDIGSNNHHHHHNSTDDEEKLRIHSNTMSTTKGTSSIGTSYNNNKSSTVVLDEDSVDTTISGPATQDEITTHMMNYGTAAAAAASTTTTTTELNTSMDESIATTTVPKTVSIETFPNTVHFSQITSTWYKDMTVLSSVSLDQIVDPITGYLRPHIIEYRTATPFGTMGGVHHSKYIICFEMDGSIVICITTANLTVPTTIDATWIQRFPPSRTTIVHNTNNHLYTFDIPDTTSSNQSADTTTTTKKASIPIRTNDFGTTMTHYLQCTMLSTAKHNVTIHWFVQTYLRWKSIRQLEYNYNFQSALVQLITVIPGNYPKPPPQQQQQQSRQKYETHRKTSVVGSAMLPPFYYGQERISYLLHQLEDVEMSPVAVASSSSSAPSSKHPYRTCHYNEKNILYTKHDQIIVQPTSFGGGWNMTNMSQLIRSYLGGFIGTTNNHKNYINDHDAIRRLEIVWPTNQFIKSSMNRLKFWNYNTNAMPTSRDDDHSVVPHDSTAKVQNGGYLFYSSEAFNKNDLSCLNRMIMFEPTSDTEQHSRGKTPLIPHFKSVTRLIGQHHGIHIRYPKLRRCEEYLSWFLLTSACLSRGAQGEEVNHKNDDGTSHTMMAYTNFEMGVLFHSCLSGNSGTSDRRIYCWNPTTNVCPTPVNNTKLPRLIHLPIPYRLRPLRYVDDEDIAMFCQTPYFHEIPPGTGCEGNMLLTPYGSDLAKQME